MADYTEFNRLAGAMPGEGQDVEAFYTPELQQMILEQLTRQAQEQGARNQGAISGQAITSGFGVGGTSREASRRARADADMLDQIVSGFVGQAQQIENQRMAQQETESERKLAASEDIANRRQQQEMAKQGYQAQFDSQQRELSDQARSARQDMLYSGLGALGGAAGTLFSQGLGGGAKSAPSMFNANPNLNVIQPRILGGSYGLNTTPFWERNQNG